MENILGRRDSKAHKDAAFLISPTTENSTYRLIVEYTYEMTRGSVLLRIIESLLREKSAMQALARFRVSTEPATQVLCFV